MKSFIIAWKDFKIRFTDRKGFFLMIFFPIILTAILGTALSGVMGDSSNLPKTSIGVIQPDDDPIGNILVSEVLKGKGLTKWVSVKKVHSEKVLARLLRDGKIDTGIVIPKDWSANLQDGQLKQVKLLTDPGKELQGTIAETVLQTFVNRVNITSSSEKTVLASSAQTLTPVALQNLASELTASLNELAKKNKDDVQDGSIGKKQVSGMQYYAAAMAAMFLLFNVTNGAKSIINERDTETLARLLSTPTSKFTILAGKFLGNLYFVLAQLSIFLIVTHLLFKVNWGENFLQTGLIGLAYSISVSGLAMLFAAIIKNLKTADTIGGLGVQVFSILGGSMIPLTLFPKSMQTVANIAPNKWALSSFVDIMAGTTWNSLAAPMAVLFSIGIISIMLGTWRLQVK